MKNAVFKVGVVFTTIALLIMFILIYQYQGIRTTEAAAMVVCFLVGPISLAWGITFYEN